MSYMFSTGKRSNDTRYSVHEVGCGRYSARNRNRAMMGKVPGSSTKLATKLRMKVT